MLQILDTMIMIFIYFSHTICSHASNQTLSHLKHTERIQATKHNPVVNLSSESLPLYANQSRPRQLQNTSALSSSVAQVKVPLPRRHAKQPLLSNRLTFSPLPSAASMPMHILMVELLKFKNEYRE